jgi:hypothetical protein
MENEDKIDILAAAAVKNFERAEKYKQIILDIVKKQSEMIDYGHPDFGEFQIYLSDVLVEVCEIEGLE